MDSRKKRYRNGAQTSAPLDEQTLQARIDRLAPPAAALCLKDLVKRYQNAGISQELALYAAEQTAQYLTLSNATTLSHLDAVRVQRYFKAIIERKAPYDSASRDFFNRQFLREYVQRSQRAGWSDRLIYNTLVAEYQSFLSPAMQQEFLAPLVARAA